MYQRPLLAYPVAVVVVLCVALSAHAELPVLNVCSFNIQFLGHFKDRDDATLAKLVKDYDIVVVQELVAPPHEGQFPDGDDYSPDTEAAEFFDEMKALGFKFELSPEDTGKGENIHVNGPATEWWVAFYRDDKVEPADDIPSGFLADDRSKHNDYDRVPYAFAFRTVDGNADFVLISVHLRPGKSNADRRKHELKSIAKWVKANDDTEKDFIILGDMNIEDAAELKSATPRGFVSLNNECRPTNTNVNGPKPYDHVMYRRSFTKTEIDDDFDLRVYNLVEACRPFWNSSAPYPGGSTNPIESLYDHNTFRQLFSDHHPVVFRMIVPAEDDDG